MLQHQPTAAAEWLRPIAERFTASYQGRVNVTFSSYGFEELFANIIDQAAEGSNLYDGFVTPPSVAGSIVEYDGWQDLAPYIQGNGDRAADWADILLGYRQTIAQYEGQILMYPLYVPNAAIWLAGIALSNECYFELCTLCGTWLVLGMETF